MKKLRTSIKIVTLCLIVAFAVSLLSPVSAFAFSSDLFDNADYSLSSNGFTYKEKAVKENGKSQALFYGEYNSTKADAEYEWVIHSVRSGSVTTKSTVLQIAEDYQSASGRKVVFAANGDYFDLNSGANMESYVNDGIVISKGSFATKHCIGFDNKGKFAIGRMTQTQPKLLVEIGKNKTLFDIDAFNQAPADDQIAVYTKVGTYNVPQSGKYVVNTDSVNLDQYPVWGSAYRLSTGEIADDKEFTLKSGQFAVVVKGKNAKFFFDKVNYGVNVSIVEIPVGDFNGCSWVLGGYDILVNDGVVNTNCHTDNSGNVAAPRTFIGVKEDGTTFVCVLDGRQVGYAIGITVNEEAVLAKTLGAKYALELDGGGSSTAIVRVNDQLVCRNKPSDGSMRKVSNAILLVEKKSDDGSGGGTVDPPDHNDGNDHNNDNDNPNNGSSTEPSKNGGIVIAIVAAGVAVVAAVVVVIVVRKKKK